jgi:hypothetical protein
MDITKDYANGRSEEEVRVLVATDQAGVCRAMDGQISRGMVHRRTDAKDVGVVT